MKTNKCVRIALMGGVLGMLLTNPRNAIDKALEQANKEGFYCRQILPHTTSNLFAKLLQIVCLACTCGLWTFGAGYLLLLEKND